MAELFYCFLSLYLLWGFSIKSKSIVLFLILSLIYLYFATTALENIFNG